MTHSHNSRNLGKARFERACWWLLRGVEVVPIRPRSKKLYRGYGPHKDRITDANSACRWFLYAHANLGVVLGGEARLIVADWDSVGDYEIWRETPGASVSTLTERTGRGYHLFFIGDDLPSTASDGCEFKTRGVCMVSPSVHPSGVAYRTVIDAPIAHIDRERACGLFPFLSETRGIKELSGSSSAHTESAPARATSGEWGRGGVVAQIKEARQLLRPARAEPDEAAIEM